MKDATVVCRQLGYGGALSAHRGATFGEGSGPIHYNEVNCRGNEEHLANCSHRHTCDNHEKDAGLICDGTPGAGQLSCVVNAVIVNLLYVGTCRFVHLCTVYCLTDIIV